MRIATKGVVALALLATTFSPFLSTGQIPMAHAQAAGDTTYIPGFTGTDGTTITSNGDGTATLTTADARTGKTSSTQVPDQLGCSLSTPSICISNLVYVFTVGLMSVFAYIGSYVFDFAVQIALNSTSYSLTFLTQGWTAVRDLANMAFIFILLYIAFTIILQADTSNTLRTLAAVVVMALLINFSFFITRVVIDAGNILAVQFYNAIPVTVGAGADSSGFLHNPVTGKTTKDLTASIMNAVQVQNLINTTSFKEFTAQQGTGVGAFLANLTTQILIYLAVGAMLAVLAFAFFTVGFKFLLRLVILWFLIISAPAAFAARALATNKKARALYDRWQDLLIKFSFYPAIFLFMFLIITTFMNALAGQQGLVPQIFADLASAPTGAGSVYLIASAIANVAIRLGFVIIMLYFGLKVSDFVVTEGNSMARNFTGWVGRRAGGAAFGTIGFAGRNTIGWGAQRIYQAGEARDMASKGGLLSRTLWRGTGALAAKSFDARGVSGLRSLAKKAGGDIGTPSGQGGYARAFDERVRFRVGEANKLKPTAAATQRAYEEAVRNPDNQEDIEKVRTAAKEVEAAKQGGNRQALRKAQKAFDEAMEPIHKQVAERTGADNPQKYATAITTKNWRNLWGAASGLPGVILASDKEAARQIRNQKAGSTSQVLALLQQAGAQPQPQQMPTAANDNIPQSERSESKGRPAAMPAAPASAGQSAPSQPPAPANPATPPLQPAAADAKKPDSLWKVSTASASENAETLNKILQQNKKIEKTLSAGFASWAKPVETGLPHGNEGVLNEIRAMRKEMRGTHSLLGEMTRSIEQAPHRTAVTPPPAAANDNTHRAANDNVLRPPAANDNDGGDEPPHAA